MARSRLRFLKSDAFVGLMLCAFIFAGVVWVREAGLLQSTELALYDRYLQYQPQISEQENRIVIVTISELDIERLGSWPMNDGVLAKLVTNLLAHDPRVIGLDLFRNLEVPPGSDQLRELFSQDIPVVTVMKFGDRISPGVPAPYMVKDKGRVAFGDALVDTGGVSRRALLFMDDGHESYSSFPLLIASEYLRREGVGARPDPDNPELLKFGRTTIVPIEGGAGGYINLDAGGYQFLLDFSSSKSGFASISLTDALAGSFPDGAVRDKIVLVGATAESLRDFFVIPIVKNAEEGQRICGIELHATTLTQLLRAALDGRKPMGFWPDWAEWIWIAIWGLVGYVIGLKVHSFRKFALLLLFVPAAILGLTFFLFSAGLWVPVAPPVLTFLLSADSFRLYQLSVERRQRALLMRFFESHVSKDIAKAIWAQREQFVDEGVPRPQQLIATVLFTDLQGFTTISEEFGDPGKLVEWLNEYMEAMTNHVFGCGGQVNKYIGDAIMAVFGVPVPRATEEDISRDAANAIRCALNMGRELERLNTKWREQNRPTVRMRVGIFTGPLVVGCIGSRQRLEYTVTGDTVNVASRLESLDKAIAADSTCRILVGESTFRYTNGHFQVKPLGSMALKGKGQRLEVYQVLGPAKAAQEQPGQPGVTTCSTG